MSEPIVLEAQQRTLTGKKVRQLRAQGLIPGVIYGPKLEAAIAIQAAERTLQNTLRQAGGTNLIEVRVGDEAHQVLVRDVQRDVIRGNLLHVDFHAVALDIRIRTEVPIHLVGESEVVKSGEGIVISEATSIEVECLPTNIPDHLTLDLSRLVEVGDTLTVADLHLPEGVTAMASPEEVLVRTNYAERVAPEVEVEEEVEAFDAEQVEVIRRGKEEEEGF